MPPVQRLVGRGGPREFTRYIDEDMLDRKIVDIDCDRRPANWSGSRPCSSPVPAARSAPNSSASSSTFESAHRWSRVDRDDSLLHHVDALTAPPSNRAVPPVIADIRDAERLDDVFARHRPELVFHAAALKHVPALEGAPSEGWKTNVARHCATCSNRRASPGRPGRQHQHRQGRRAGERPRLHQAHRRAAHRRQRPAHRPTVRFGAVRQRDRQPRLGDRDLRAADPQRRPGHRSPIPTSPATSWRSAKQCGSRCRRQRSDATAEVLVLDMGTPGQGARRRHASSSSARAQDIEIVYTGLRPGREDARSAARRRREAPTGRCTR